MDKKKRIWEFPSMVTVYFSTKASQRIKLSRSPDAHIIRSLGGKVRTVGDKAIVIPPEDWYRVSILDSRGQLIINLKTGFEELRLNESGEITTFPVCSDEDDDLWLFGTVYTIPVIDENGFFIRNNHRFKMWFSNVGLSQSLKIEGNPSNFHDQRAVLGEGFLKVGFRRHSCYPYAIVSKETGKHILTIDLCMAGNLSRGRECVLFEGGKLTVD